MGSIGKMWGNIRKYEKVWDIILWIWKLGEMRKFSEVDGEVGDVGEWGRWGRYRSWVSNHINENYITLLTSGKDIRACGANRSSANVILKHTTKNNR